MGEERVRRLDHFELHVRHIAETGSWIIRAILPQTELRNERMARWH